MTDEKKCKIDCEKCKAILKDFSKDHWKISTIVLATLSMILLIINVSSCGITGNVISAKEVGEKVLDFASSRGADAGLVSINDNGQFYEVILSIQGQDVPVFVTKDGENLIPSLIPLTGQVIRNVPQQQTSADWSVFENELPADIKSKILSFNYEEPKVYDEKLRINEFKNYELIPKTLISFYGAGCGWCTKYHPVLVEAMEKYPEVTIYALDLRENKDIAEKYGATGTPANVINGKYFVNGYRPIEDLSEILNKLN